MGMVYFEKIPAAQREDAAGVQKIPETGIHPDRRIPPLEGAARKHRGTCGVSQAVPERTPGAAWVFAAWIAAALAMYLLQKHQILGTREFLIGSALFYVGDLVCLLIWCPFRDIFMKTRCCTQCRIYNWDVLMLIVPILFVRGFFSYSLLLPALAVVGTWEWNYRRHPERFLPSSNACLQCRNCQGEIGCVRLRLFGKKF